MAETWHDDQVKLVTSRCSFIKQNNRKPIEVYTCQSQVGFHSKCRIQSSAIKTIDLYEFAICFYFLSVSPKEVRYATP
jgi:hypothetical protein